MRAVFQMQGRNITITKASRPFHQCWVTKYFSAHRYTVNHIVTPEVHAKKSLRQTAYKFDT